MFNDINNALTAVCSVGIMLPFIGTVLGSALVFFIKDKMSEAFKVALLGFASGVMIAASVWSLIIPAVEMSGSWIPAAVGFMLGIFLLMFIDKITSGGGNGHFMSVFAIVLHNIPEGMAVGVIYAALLDGAPDVTPMAALALSAGIAAQNLPEGAIVSAPLAADGISKKKSFFGGVLSGIVEPIGALITLLLTSLIVPILPYVLSFAAGSMIYVVVNELIPQSQTSEHCNIGTIGLSFGFTVMMVLDIALS